MIIGNRSRRWAGLAVLAASLAMIVLDGTVVGVALPTVIADLHLDLTDAQWVNSLYSVVFAALLITAGRIGDRFGRRRLLLIGLAVFVLGSVCAALSSGIGALLGARALQGLGGALVLPSTLSAVNATFRGRDRATAFGIWGAVMSGAAALGPLLGGWLTQLGSWRLVFWVNVPIGILVLVAAILLVDENRSGAVGRAGLDIGGTLLSAAGLGLIVFGLIESSTLGWWRPKAVLDLPGLSWPTTAPISPVPVAIAVGGLLLFAFVGWESRRRRIGRATVLDLGLFGIRTFVFGNVTAMLVAVGEFALVFVLPLFLITSLGLSTLAAGLVLAAMAAGAFVSGAAARHLAAAIGATRVVVLGLALEVVGAALTAVTVGLSGPGWSVALTLLPYGLGLGLASAQLTSTTLRDIPTDRSGSGSATQSTVRQLGSALGSAVGGATLAGVLGGRATPGPDTDPATFATAGAAAIWASVSILAIALVAAWRLDRVSGRRPDQPINVGDGGTTSRPTASYRRG
ncbi:MFS transporter [Microlunatus soli]|uniref:Drug resistance transporter, EmrB/QacA subfamily n=1 Tax=Microlunatus soli TaxID=630515 RepID=A0A1H1U8H3_9ACTN|nr:drug resistance transporter, EmrB/QacA subfamily [Microlunatus soli]